jgi:lipid II:glycine glycyltransferase (peptidoglycan interpeptide bridge formation enzyme)
MAKWQLLSNEAARETWDEALLRLDDCTPFQSYAWGEYQRALGWEPCHWAAFNENGEVVAMMLGLLRRYPFGIGLIWSEGGPVGDLSVCDESFQQAIKQTIGVRWVYCRFRCDRQRDVEDSLRLNMQGWRRSWFNLQTCYSLRLNLAKEETQLLGGFERNWRRNLRRACEGDLTVKQWTDPSVDEIVSAYDSMQSLKGLEEQHSREEFEKLILHLKDHLVLYRGADEQGQLLSLHGWLILGKRARAFLSVTTEEGRRLHSSYAVFWSMVQHCLRLQLESADLGGIDPIRSPGPYRFKKATGAVTVEYLGEWDWASRPWLQWLGNWAISRRQRLRAAESALKSSRRSESLKPSFDEPRSDVGISEPRIA